MANNQNIVNAGDIVDGRFQLVKQIGEGASAVVWHATDLFCSSSTSPNKSVALKLFLQNDQYFQQMFSLEGHLLSTINHPNVLNGVKYGKAELSIGKSQLSGSNGPFKVTKIKKREVLYLTTGLAQQFDLADFLMHTYGFSELLSLVMFYQLMQGIQTIHQTGYANRDIKAENILIDQSFGLRIADLGLSAPIDGCSCLNEQHDLNNHHCCDLGKLYQIAGTECLLAPEIRAYLGEGKVHQGYDGQAVDVFNAGIVLFNLLFATGPFHSASADDDYYKHIFKNDSRGFWNKQVQRNLNVSSLSPKVLKLIDCLIDSDPKKRPSVQMTIKITKRLIQEQVQAQFNIDQDQDLDIESDLYPILQSELQNRLEYMTEKKNQGMLESV